MNSPSWRLLKGEFLVATEEILVALATVPVAILSPVQIIFLQANAFHRASNKQGNWALLHYTNALVNDSLFPHGLRAKQASAGRM